MTGTRCSSPICRDSADCATRSPRAAFDTVPSSATVTKVLRCLSSIRLAYAETRTISSESIYWTAATICFIFLLTNPRKSDMRRFPTILLAALGLACAVTRSGAETYPSRPITMIVPFAAGAPVDLVGRQIAERMR